MDRDEVKRLLFTLSEKYTTFKIDPQMLSFKIDAWLEDLAPYSYEDVKKACAVYRDNERSAFAPSTSQIIGLIKDCSAETMTAIEAWGLVRKAIRNSYYAEEEFAKLNPVIQRAVGSPSLLRDYGYLESTEIEQCIQPRFFRAYEAAVKENALKPYMSPEKRQALESKVYKHIPLLEVPQEEKGMSEECARMVSNFLESMKYEES